MKGKHAIYVRVLCLPSFLVHVTDLSFISQFSVSHWNIFIIISSTQYYNDKLQVRENYTTFV